MDELLPVWVEEKCLDAEQYILGVILSEKGGIDLVREKVRPEMFRSDTNRLLYECACELQDQGINVDISTVGDRFNKKGGNWDREYLSRLVLAATTSGEVTTYCDILEKESKRIALMEFHSKQYKDLAYGAEPNESAVDMVKAIETFTGVSENNKVAISYGDTANEVVEDIVDVQSGAMLPYVKSGYPALDKVLGGGFQQNGLYILAARPGKGKTTFALNIAHRIARSGKKVLFVSLEMDRKQLASRLMAIEVGHISATSILSGKLDEKQSDNVLQSMKRAKKIPIDFNVMRVMKLKDIQFTAKVSKADFIVIDYLGLIANDKDIGKLYEETTKKSKSLKQMARELECPILCLAQLNRESEKRDSKKPRLSDLRDSGSIEQDADAVIFNYIENDNEESYLPEGQTVDPVDLTLLVAKNRHGRTGQIDMYWDKVSGMILEIKK